MTTLIRLTESRRHWSALVLALTACTCILGADAPKDAAQKVRDGLAFFRSGDYSEAETAFDEASEISPENATIMFDKACAALAGGDADQARGLFQAAASAKDAGIAVHAHYNLGCLEADQAREKLGDDPVAAVGDVREESVKMLLTSVRHYRDVLNLNPQHKDARHNLELIRLFIKHIQSQWAERDRQRDREEKDLLQFVMMLEEKESAMRTVNRRLQPEADGVQRRQALRENADAQRTLQEEIEPLKEKISQAFAQQQPQQGQPAATPPQPDEQQQEALDMMNGIADEIGSNILSAANATANANLEDATATQTKALDLLNQLYMIAAPYDNVLQRSIKQQQRLAPETSPQVAEAADAPESSEEDEGEEPDAGPVAAREIGENDVEQQGRITDWSHLLPLKAEAMLPQVQQQLESLKENLPAEEEPAEEIELEIAGDDEKPADDDSEDEPTPEEAQAEQMKQQVAQMEGLVKSMELAIMLAPEAEQHSQAAVEHLNNEKAVEAGPEQQETLRILKEIAEPLQQDQNEDQQQSEDQQDQENSEDQNDQQQNQDEQNQQPQEQEQQSENQQEQQQQREQEAKQQQAESVLQQARERERKHREDMKKIRAYLMRGMKVDKDW